VRKTESVRCIVDRGITRLTGARPSTIQDIYRLSSDTIEGFIDDVRRQLEEKMISTQRSVLYPVTQIVIKSTGGLTYDHMALMVESKYIHLE
jgi:hypothetical protein